MFYVTQVSYQSKYSFNIQRVAIVSEIRILRLRSDNIPYQNVLLSPDSKLGKIS